MPRYDDKKPFKEREEDPRRLYGDRKTRPMEANSLSPDVVAQINEGRAPSKQVVPQPMCGARTKHPNAKSTHCTFPAGAGTDHPGFGQCKHHGGLTPAGRKSAALAAARDIANRHRQEIIDFRVETSLSRFGGDRTLIPPITPEEALLEEVTRSVAMVRWLEEQIGMWPTDAGPEDLGGLPQVVAETSKGNPGATDHQVWMVIYREERAHLARVSKMTIDAGVSQSVVRLAQTQGAALAKGIRTILTQLGLSPDQSDVAREIVPRVLHALTTGEMDGLPSDLVLPHTQTIPSSATVR